MFYNSITNIPVLINGTNINTSQHPALNYRPYGAPYSYIYIPASELTRLGATVTWDSSQQRLIISSTCSTIIAAMQRDIDLLKSQSPTQQDSESYYATLKDKPTIVAAKVTSTEIRFVGKPQVFSGNYTGQYAEGKSYPFYSEADIGGKRFYIVKDNFGVWNSFKYIEPI